MYGTLSHDDFSKCCKTRLNVCVGGGNQTRDPQHVEGNTWNKCVAKNASFLDMKAFPAGLWEAQFREIPSVTVWDKGLLSKYISSLLQMSFFYKQKKQNNLWWLCPIWYPFRGIPILFKQNSFWLLFVDIWWPSVYSLYVTDVASRVRSDMGREYISTFFTGK